MNIKNIEIQNFLIIGQAVVDLSNRGLCRIAGENSDDATSSSNGAGKSSIIEAIYWALFGETLRNVRTADGVVNNKAKKDCSVVVEIEEGDVSYRVERYRKHEKHKNNLYLYINGVDSRGKDNRETQAYIETVIGMDKMAFANSVIFGQGHSKNLKRFSEMTDAEKKSTLEKILDLEVFTRSHDLVRSSIKGATEEYTSLVTKSEELARRTITAETRVAEAIRRAQEFAVQQAFRVEEAEKRRDLCKENISSLSSRVESLVVEDTVSLEGLIEDCEEFVSSELERKSRLSDAFMERRNKHLMIKASIVKDVEVRERKLANLFDPEHVGENCEFCGNLVKETSLITAKDGLEFDLQDFKGSLDHVTAEIEKVTVSYKKKVKSIEASISAGKELLQSQRVRLKSASEISNKRSQLKHQVEAQEGVLVTLEADVVAAQDLDNSWEDAAKQYAGDLEDLSAEADSLKSSLKVVEETLSYYEFWKTAFSRKGIRSYMLDRIVPFLNERVGHYLNILTEGGIEAVFHTTKNLASGESRDNFNLEITNRNAADTYEGNSGGEKRRIDLGVALGFNDFLASRSGKRFNILLLDEVFEGIDEDGLYYVIKVLEDIARRKSSVLVITHRDELKSYFSDEILMERSDGLSYIRN